MPIKRYASGRKGKKPFFYFKGTPKEANQVSQDKIMAAFRGAGFNFPTKKAARDAARNLKAKVQALLGQEQRDEQWVGRQRTIVLPTAVGTLNFRLTILKNGKIVVHQHPVTHGVNWYVDKRERFIHSFAILKKILAKGFRTRGHGENALRYTKRGKIAVPNEQPTGETRRIYGAVPKNAEERATKGDSFAIEMMAPFKEVYWEEGELSKMAIAEKASPNKILCVNIELKEGISKAVEKRKRAFYKKALEGYSIHFVKSQGGIIR